MKIGEAYMTLADYQKSYSSLRKVLRKDTEYAGHFAKFYFNMRGTGRQRAEIGVWSSRTNNVVAVMNRKGTVFIRPNSIYNQALKGSSHKVLNKDNLINFRGSAGNTVRTNALLNPFAERAWQRLINNKDKAGRVFMFSFPQDININGYWFENRLRQLLSKNASGQFPNTQRSLSRSNFVIEDSVKDDKRKLYINITDYSEQIAREQREEAAIQHIVSTFVNNWSDIYTNLVLNRQGVNPIEFKYSYGDDYVYGQIRSNYIDWDMISVNREFFEDSIRSAICFTAEPSTSLPERPEHAEVEAYINRNQETVTYAEPVNLRTSFYREFAGTVAHGWGVTEEAPSRPEEPTSDDIARAMEMADELISSDDSFPY